MEERVLAMEAEAEASSQLGGVRAPARARVMTHSLVAKIGGNGCNLFAKMHGSG